MAIRPKKTQQEAKILSVEEQEVALKKVESENSTMNPSKRKIYRHTIDVPAELAHKIEGELKKTHLSKRGFWLKIAEDYFSKNT